MLLVARVKCSLARAPGGEDQAEVRAVDQSVSVQVRDAIRIAGALSARSRIGEVDPEVGAIDFAIGEEVF